MMAGKPGGKSGASKKCHGKRKGKAGLDRFLAPDLTESSYGRDDYDIGESVGALNKREILSELSLVRRRLKAKFARWEAGHTTYVGNIEGNVDESLFPRGFGYYLMSETIPREEAYLEAIREMIMAVSSNEIQDGLLLFLHDYVVQSKQLREICQQRQEVLSHVHDWLVTDFGGLKQLKLDCLDEAMNAEGSIRRLYLQTLNVMERLGILRKQLMMIDRAKRLEPGATESTLKCASESAMTAEGGSQFTGPNDPTETLSSMVQSIRHSGNDELIESILLKLRTLGSMLSTWDLDIRQARAHIRRRQEERERYVEDIEDIRSYNDKLHEQIKLLKEQKEPPRSSSSQKLEAAEEEEGEKSQPKAVNTKEVGCQVNELSLEDVNFLPQPKVPQAKVSVVGKKSKRIMSGRRRGSGSSSKSLKGRSKVKESVISKSASTLKDVSVDKSSKSLESQKSERLAPDKTAALLTGSQDSVEVAESPSQQPDKKRSKSVKATQSAVVIVAVDTSSETGVDDKPRILSHAELAEEMCSYWEERGRRKHSRPHAEVSGEIPEPEPDDALTIPYDKLFELLQRHISNLLGIAQPLLEELMALRRNARMEIKHIKDREAAMSDMERTLDQFIMQLQIEKENLPFIQLSGDKGDVVVSNRNPEPHKCSLCMCQDTTTEILDVGEVGSTLLLKKTLETCSTYKTMLQKLGETYVDLGNKLTQGRSTISNLLGQLVWGELGTSDYSNLDEDVDNEMVWLLEKARRIPMTLHDLKKHCVFTTSTVRLIVRDTVAILKHAKIRITDLKSQNEELRQLEKEMYQARGILDDYALHMTRFRAGSDMLQNGVTIAMSKCPFCKCYNSVLDDKTRTTSVEDRKAKTKLILMNTTALLQQALGGVLRASEKEAIMLAGVDPRVIEQVQDTQLRLSAALDCMSEENLSKKPRPSMVLPEDKAGEKSPSDTPTLTTKQ